MLITFDTFLTHKYTDYKTLKKERRNIVTHKINFIKYISNNSFEDDFIKKIVSSKLSNFYVFTISNSNSFDINNYIGFLILRKSDIFYDYQSFTIPLFAIYKNAQNKGYGSMMLNELKLLIKSKHNKTCHIYLHAINNTKNFYISNGFNYSNYTDLITTYENIEDHDTILKLVF